MDLSQAEAKCQTVEDWRPYTDEVREELLARIERYGYLVVVPKEDELFIDIDTEEQHEEFQNRLMRFCIEYPNTRIVSDTPSKSGLPHRHIIVSIGTPFESDFERVALQSCLGSDPMRELLSFVRVWNDVLKPIVFFEKEAN